jgi:hypothetical protein
MTEEAAEVATTTAPWRRTAVLLTAWIAAVIVAGIPGDSGGTARAEQRVSQAPVVQNTGPECFAGHGGAPPASKGGD